MSIFRRAVGRAVESRALSFQQVFGTGIDTVRGSDPLTLIPLFAAHRTIIDAVASTPLHAYRERSDGTKERMARQPALFKPLWGTPFTWKAQCVASLLSHGNAYGLWTGIDDVGRPTGLMWLDPRRVQVEDNEALGPTYLLDSRPLPEGQVVHIPWIVQPGQAKALSPLAAFKSAIEMGQYAQQTGRDWFANGAIPSGHLKNSEMTLDPAQASEIKERFKANVSGRETLVTGKDWDFHTIGVPADEARFIESMKLSATQIASIYGVPPEEIGGEKGSSLTYKTLEADELRFNARVVRPWAIRIEEHLTALLPRPQYARFNLDANVRADLMTRSQAHEINLRTGVETLDEARRLEDRPPLTPAEKDELKASRSPAPAAEPADPGADDDPTD